MEVKMIMDLSGFDNYENLVKGIDKSKMVQVQVTVKGKNGTFTRKQWKRASAVTPKRRKSRIYLREIVNRDWLRC